VPVRVEVVVHALVAHASGGWCRAGRGWPRGPMRTTTSRRPVPAGRGWLSSSSSRRASVTWCFVGQGSGAGARQRARRRPGCPWV